MANWHELIIEGGEKVVRAFVTGFRAGRGETAEGVFGADVEIEPESIGERLKALFSAGSHHAFFAPASFATLLAAALSAEGAKVGLRMERERVIDSPAVLGAGVDGPTGRGDRDGLLEAGEAEFVHATRQRDDRVPFVRRPIVLAYVAEVHAAFFVDAADGKDGYSDQQTADRLRSWA